MDDRVNRARVRALGALALAAVLAACGGGQAPPSETARALPGEGTAPAGGGGGAAQINGAGATFPNPLYSKWFSEYAKIHPDVRINRGDLVVQHHTPCARVWSRSGKLVHQDVVVQIDVGSKNPKKGDFS